MSWLRDAMEKLHTLSRDTVETIEGRNYSTVSLHPVRQPEVVPIIVGTLFGLLDWLEKEGEELNVRFAHVENPELVWIIDNLKHEWKSRDIFSAAKLRYSKFQFNEFMEMEDALIQLQTKFVQTDEMLKVLKALSKIKVGTEVLLEDDGISQTVTAKDEVGRFADAKVAPMVLLQPYRTFREVDQPESVFLLRIKRAHEGRLPRVALFEADGGAWRIEAAHNISEYLRNGIKKMDKLKDKVTVIC